MHSQQFNKIKDLKEKYNKNFSCNHFCYIIGNQKNIIFSDLNVSNTLMI